MKRALVLLVISALLVTGCGNSTTSQKVDGSTDQIESSSSSDAWKCNSEQDGLGENFSCASSTKDSEGKYWVLTIMCTSDGISRNSIVGVDSNANKISWSVGKSIAAKIRIDSLSIEKWNLNTKAGGQGLSFGVGTTITDSNADADENGGTWKLLSAIAGAKTIGFQATNAANYPESALFNIENSVPIAAKFNVMGCRT